MGKEMPSVRADGGSSCAVHTAASDTWHTAVQTCVMSFGGGVGVFFKD